MDSSKKSKKQVTALLPAADEPEYMQHRIAMFDRLKLVYDESILGRVIKLNSSQTSRGN